MLAPPWVVSNWPASATIFVMRCKGLREGTPADAHSLLRHVRDRWSIENSWRWPRSPPGGRCSSPLATQTHSAHNTSAPTNDLKSQLSRFRPEQGGVYAHPEWQPFTPLCSPSDQSIRTLGSTPRKGTRPFKAKDVEGVMEELNRIYTSPAFIRLDKVPELIA
jgi:hypothetical protein